MRSEQKKQLIDLRSELVGALHTHPSSVYSDKTIEDLLDAQPKTLTELAKVKGFPPNGKRIRCFGRALVQIFNPVKGNPLPAVTNAKMMDAFSDSKTKKAVTKGISLALISVLTATSTVNAKEISRSSTFLIDNPSPSITTDFSASNLAKRTFLEKSKKEASAEWQKIAEEKYREKLKKEEDEKQKEKKLIAEAKARKAELKKDAVKQVAAEIEEAKHVALASAKKAEKLSKELDKLAKKNQEASKSARGGLLSNYESYGVAKSSSQNKSWMPYLKESGSSIFEAATPQRRLQERAYTGKYGIRMVDGRYCVALGSHYTSTIGTKVDIVLAGGVVIPCILGDQKADCDTDSTNSYHLSDGSYVEFIVDRGAMNSTAKRMGNFNYVSEFKGCVTEIRVEK